MDNLDILDNYIRKLNKYIKLENNLVDVVPILMLSETLGRDLENCTVNLKDNLSLAGSIAKTLGDLPGDSGADEVYSDSSSLEWEISNWSSELKRANTGWSDLEDRIYPLLNTITLIDFFEQYVEISNLK